MADRETISVQQVITLMVVSRLTLTVVFFSGPLDVKQDVWWQSFPAALFHLPLSWVIIRWLWERFPLSTFTEMLQAILGTWPGRLVTLLYSGFFLLNFSLTLRFTAEFFSFAFLPTTPMIVMMAVVAVLSAWAARAGLEVIGRASQVVFPLLVGSIVLILILLAKDIHGRYLLPLEILHTGPIPHLRDMFNVSTRTLEFLWLGMALPYVKERSRLFRSVVTAQVWLGALWVVVGLVIFGILGREVERYYFPFFVAARTISIADFLERVDAIFPAIWTFGMFLRGGLLLWAAAVSTAQALGVRNYRVLVSPLVGIGVTYAVVQADSFVELQNYLVPEILTPFMFTFVWAIPLLLVVVAAFRRPAGTSGGV